MLIGWRSNVDLQITIDEKRTRMNATKYSTKGETKSEHMIDAITKAVEISRRGNTEINELTPKRILTKAMMKLSGQRDYSVQETCHLLLGLPLTQSSFVFKTINFKNTTNYSRNKKVNEAKINKNVFEFYSNRNQNSNIKKI